MLDKDKTDLAKILMTIAHGTADQCELNGTLN